MEKIEDNVKKETIRFMKEFRPLLENLYERISSSYEDDGHAFFAFYLSTAMHISNIMVGIATTMYIDIPKDGLSDFCAMLGDGFKNYFENEFREKLECAISEKSKKELLGELIEELKDLINNCKE